MLANVSCCCVVFTGDIRSHVLPDCAPTIFEHKGSSLERAPWVVEARKGKEIHCIFPIYCIVKNPVVADKSQYSNEECVALDDGSKLGLFPVRMQHNSMDLLLPQD